MLTKLNEKLSGHRTILAAWVGVAVLAVACALGLDLSAIGVEGPITWAAVIEAGWAAIVVTFLRKGVDRVGANGLTKTVLPILLFTSILVLACGCVSAESRAAAWAISQDLPVYVDAVVPSPDLAPERQQQVRRLGELLKRNAARLAGELGEPDGEGAR